jgi:AraC family transcriptional regulator
MSEPATQAKLEGASSIEAYRARLSRALSYVQERLGGEISLAGAAEAACFSKYHFHRIFSAAMGESFADCVRRLRIERAANLLERRPDLRITDIALLSGFATSSLLCRVFSGHFGSPPSRWRQERVAAARAMSRSDLPRGKDEPSSSLWAKAAFGPASGNSGREDGELRLRRLPALRFATCLHIGPYGKGIGESWALLFKWAGPRGLLTPTARIAGVSWDNPELCPIERCRYSACLSVPEDLALPPEIVELRFPERSYLCLHFTGPESCLTDAYSGLYRRQLPESGFEPEDDPAVEFYNRPVREGEDFDLEIALPVRPLS